MAAPTTHSYAGTREQELAAPPCDAAQKAAFVEMQFDAQPAQYQEHSAGATFDIILLDGQPAGRLHVSWSGLRSEL
jgi:hypothetical protein